MPWLVKKVFNGVHVIPLGDEREHTTTRACKCGPTRDTEKRDVWIHHSADEREKFETGERKPS